MATLRPAGLFALVLVLVLIVLVFISALVHADVYMHNPRGSNNRLNEANNNRDNANRLFDSQNNNQGGYNVGYMYYHVGSILPIEWTMQHGCEDPNLHCQVVLQYACDRDQPGIRDGTSTTTIPNNEEDALSIEFGMHENFESYQRCSTRARNGGLWAPNEDDLGNDPTAVNTRQNPDGNRSGFECPEERDYYPYWHPTIWRDIAVMVDTEDMDFLCPIYQSQSQNVASKGACSIPEHNNAAACQAAGGNWVEHSSWGTEAPACVPSCWSRDNHLGNTRGGYACQFDWQIPELTSDQCVLRLRYNITTGDVRDLSSSDSATNVRSDDFRWWTVDSSDNEVIIADYPGDGDNQNVVLQNNPEVDFGLGINLQLAVNVAQYGRVFQDRSHAFSIVPRPPDAGSSTIHNLNVRGKRGNIVQVYPGVEYDFIPNTLNMREGEIVHIQWTGSNTNPNGNDGEGQQGTDRSNFVQINNMNMNWPTPRSNYTYLRPEDRRVRQYALLNGGGQTSTLDDASPYFDGGCTTLNQPGTYYYMSTRNNNFSNRSQKGAIVVNSPRSGLSTAALAGIIIGSIVGVGLVAALVIFFVRHPNKLKFCKRDPTKRKAPRSSSSSTVELVSPSVNSSSMASTRSAAPAPKTNVSSAPFSQLRSAFESPPQTLPNTSSPQTRPALPSLTSPPQVTRSSSALSAGSNFSRTAPGEGVDTTPGIKPSTSKTPHRPLLRPGSSSSLRTPSSLV